MEKKINFYPVQTTPFRLSVKIKSHLWQLINATIFRLFPNQLKQPRIILLRMFGAKLANTVNISRTSRIDHPWNLEMGHLSSLGEHSWAYCLDKITIGEKCCIGKDVYLLTGNHDISDLNFTLKIKPINIGNGCWVATGSYILPGVSLGDYTVVAAKSVVIKNTENFDVVAGNPALKIQKRMFKEE